MCLMSVSLARPRLDEAFPSRNAGQLGQSMEVFQRVVLCARFQASLSRRSHGVPIAVLVCS